VRGWWPCNANINRGEALSATHDNMPISEITIQNFKGVGERVTVPLRPITLLFGANSAGKSTVLQALLYLRELLEHGNADADRLSTSGTAIDLGGFQRFVHGHDLSRTVEIGVSVGVDDDGLPVYPVDGEDGEGRAVDLPLCGIKTARVIVAVRWNVQLERPGIASYTVHINDEMAAQIVASRALDSSERMVLVAERHPIFTSILGCETEEDAQGKEGDQNERSLTLGVPFSVDCEDVIPKFGEALPRFNDVSAEDSFFFGGERGVRRLLSHVLVGAGELVLKELQRIRYIGPIRTVPDRNFSAFRSPVEGRWADGSAAWDDLHHACEVPPWLNTEQIQALGLGYRIESYRYFEVPSQSVLGGALEKATRGIADALVDLEGIPHSDLLKIRSRARLLMVAEESQVEVSPSEVGVGVSQLLPVVIGAMKPGYSILAVEQPELHIHPAVQCRLADVLANQVLGKERIVLLETHSEHLMLRLLRRIRELHEEELPPGAPTIAPADLSVVYVSSTPEGVQMCELPVTEDGDFSRQWPKGFFEERAEELF
jgi:hypothetical protein